MIKFLHILIFVFVSITPFGVWGQKSTLYVEQKTLSQSIVNCIVYDQTGFMWIGSQDGLSRFDGNFFEKFRHNTSDSTSISSDEIRSVTVDKDNNLWIVTLDGVNFFDRSTGNFSKLIIVDSQADKDLLDVFICSNGDVWFKSYLNIYRYSVDEKKVEQIDQDRVNFNSNNDKTDIIEDNNGAIWYGSHDGLGVYDVKKKIKTHYTYNPNSSNSISDNEVHSLFIDKKGLLWIGTGNGFCSLRKKDEKIKRFLYNDSQNRAKYCIYGITQSADNNLWLASNHGLLVFNPETETIVTYEELNRFKKLNTVMCDSTGVIWTGTPQGFFKISPLKKRFKHYHKQKKEGTPFPGNNIHSIYVDDNEIVWLGSKGQGVWLYDKKKNTVINTFLETSNSALKSNTVDVVFCDSKKNIWIGTDKGLHKYNRQTKDIIPYQPLGIDSKGLGELWISAMYEDRKGKLWIGTRGSGLFCISGNKIKSYTLGKQNNNSISSNEIYCIHQTEDGYIWIGTDEGLNKFDPESEKFEIFKKGKDKIRSLSHNSVLSICETSDSILWLGTEGGLNRLNIQTNEIEIYNRGSQHLHSDYIYAILKDEGNNLWLASNLGLSRFSIRLKNTIIFKPYDGVQANEFNRGAVFKAKSGEFFFGGINGFNSFYPKDIIINHAPARVLITSISYRTKEGKKVSIYTENINSAVIPYGAYHIIFNYAKFDAHSHGHNKFRYRLAKGSETWINIENKNSVEYSNIPSGVSKFEILATNSDGIWNDTASVFTIRVETPLWQSSSAIFLYVFILVMGLFFILRRTSKNLRAATLLLEEKDRASKEIENQRKELATKNANITDSLVYARHIIDAMMPSERYFMSLLNSSFILSMPKDIVSGDFFWITEMKGKIYMAVVDCTGHGVPGALMSITGLDLLRNITERGISEPHEILNELNKGVAKAFDTNKTEDTMQDGMDISLCVIDRKEEKMDFAGAFNPMLLIRNGNLIEIKADRFSIGHASIREQRTFAKHTIPLEKDDIIYFSSDGYADQFGGPDGKKFKKRRFRYLLLSIHKERMEKQKAILENTLLNWRGELDQVDDILLIGIRPLRDTVH